MGKRALITGITGQDGSYMKELLLRKGYEVHGLFRRSSSRSYDDMPDVVVHYGDLSDVASIRRAISAAQPDEVYNLGGQTQVRISFQSPDYTVDVNGRGVLHILEAIKELTPHTRFYQAGSSEMYGKTPSPQSETTPFQPQSPYACAKVYAHFQTINFREAYGLFACNGICFNHESPRRGEDFVTRKVAQAAARIHRGLQTDLKLGRLDCSRDWGWAPDYVQAMWMMLQADTPGDYVIATGQLNTVEDFVREVFAYLGMDWTEFVVHDPAEVRPLDVHSLQGDITKIRKHIGWEPSVKFDELVGRMVDAEMDILENRA